MDDDGNPAAASPAITAYLPLGASELRCYFDEGDAHLGWQAVPGAEGYNIYAGSNPHFTADGSTLVDAVDSSTLVYVHPVAGADPIYFKVAATKGNDVGIPSNAAGFTPASVSLVAVVPTLSGSGEVIIEWNAVPQADRYRVYRFEVPLQLELEDWMDDYQVNGGWHAVQLNVPIHEASVEIYCDGDSLKDPTAWPNAEIKIVGSAGIVEFRTGSQLQTERAFRIEYFGAVDSSLIGETASNTFYDITYELGTAYQYYVVGINEYPLSQPHLSTPIYDHSTVGTTSTVQVFEPTDPEEILLPNTSTTISSTHSTHAVMVTTASLTTFYTHSENTLAIDCISGTISATPIATEVVEQQGESSPEVAQLWVEAQVPDPVTADDPYAIISHRHTFHEGGVLEYRLEIEWLKTFTINDLHLFALELPIWVDQYFTDLVGGSLPFTNGTELTLPDGDQICFYNATTYEVLSLYQITCSESYDVRALRGQGLNDLYIDIGTLSVTPGDVTTFQASVWMGYLPFWIDPLTGTFHVDEMFPSPNQVHPHDRIITDFEDGAPAPMQLDTAAPLEGLSCGYLTASNSIEYFINDNQGYAFLDQYHILEFGWKPDTTQFTYLPTELATPETPSWHDLQYADAVHDWWGMREITLTDLTIHRATFHLYGFNAAGNFTLRVNDAFEQNVTIPESETDADWVAISIPINALEVGINRFWFTSPHDSPLKIATYTPAESSSYASDSQWNNLNPDWGSALGFEFYCYLNTERDLPIDLLVELFDHDLNSIGTATFTSCEDFDTSDDLWEINLEDSVGVWTMHRIDLSTDLQAILGKQGLSSPEFIRSVTLSVPAITDNGGYFDTIRFEHNRYNPLHSLSWLRTHNTPVPYVPRLEFVPSSTTVISTSGTATGSYSDLTASDYDCYELQSTSGSPATLDITFDLSGFFDQSSGTDIVGIKVLTDVSYTQKENDEVVVWGNWKATYPEGSDSPISDYHKTGESGTIGQVTYADRALEIFDDPYDIWVEDVGDHELTGGELEQLWLAYLSSNYNPDPADFYLQLSDAGAWQTPDEWRTALDDPKWTTFPISGDLYAFAVDPDLVASNALQLRWTCDEVASGTNYLSVDHAMIEIAFRNDQFITDWTVSPREPLTYLGEEFSYGLLIPELTRGGSYMVSELFQGWYDAVHRGDGLITHLVREEQIATPTEADISYHYAISGYLDQPDRDFMIDYAQYYLTQLLISSSSKYKISIWSNALVAGYLDGKEINFTLLEDQGFPDAPNPYGLDLYESSIWLDRGRHTLAVNVTEITQVAGLTNPENWFVCKLENLYGDWIQSSARATLPPHGRAIMIYHDSDYIPAEASGPYAGASLFQGQLASKNYAETLKHAGGMTVGFMIEGGVDVTISYMLRDIFTCVRPFDPSIPPTLYSPMDPVYQGQLVLTTDLIPAPLLRVWDVPQDESDITNVPADDSLLETFMDCYGSVYASGTIPFTYFIDKTGAIKYDYHGAGEILDMDSNIFWAPSGLELLQELGSPTATFDYTFTPEDLLLKSYFDGRPAEERSVTYHNAFDSSNQAAYKFGGAYDVNFGGEDDMDLWGNYEKHHGCGWLWDLTVNQGSVSDLTRRSHHYYWAGIWNPMCSTYPDIGDEISIDGVPDPYTVTEPFSVEAFSLPPMSLSEVTIKGKWWRDLAVLPDSLPERYPAEALIADDNLAFALTIGDSALPDVELTAQKAVPSASEYDFTTDGYSFQLDVPLDDLLVYTGVEPIHITLATPEDTYTTSQGAVCDFNRQFAITEIIFETPRFEKTLTPEEPSFDIRWIPDINGQLEELYLYIPSSTPITDVNAPTLTIADLWVARRAGPEYATVVEEQGHWESAEADYGAGWYRVTELGTPWVMAGNSYRLSITASPGQDLTIPYMWPVLGYKESGDPKFPRDLAILSMFGFESTLAPWGMPILKARIAQESHVLVPTETYGEHVWEGVLEPYAPTYSVLLRAVRGVYGRFLLDYTRFGQEWNGLTVPVTFQSNQRGGGMFSFVLSQPITPYFLNHSFLTSYMLLNVIGGRLTSYTTGLYDVLGDTNRTLVGYDELFYDKTSWFQVPEWGLSDIDAVGRDYAGDGHGGADWHRSYEEEDWHGERDFTAELRLRLPTIEALEWEDQLNTGTLARCPIVELEEISFNIEITSHVITQRDAGAIGDRLWVRLELHTFQGGWLNDSFAVDISSYDEATTIPIVYDLREASLRLWDGKAFKENDREYQEGIISAPYLVLEVFDADPQRYFVETNTRTHRLAGIVQEISHASYARLIDDSTARAEFRRDHLIDASLLGINVKTDQDYLDSYRNRVTSYQKLVNVTLAEAADWSIGSGKWLGILLAVVTIIWSAYTIVYSAGTSTYAGVMGLFFAIDRLQAMFTYSSIFSSLVGMIAIPIWSARAGWTPEQTQIAYDRFNVWAIAGGRSAEAQTWNSLWSTFLAMAIIHGPSVFKWFAKGIKAGIKWFYNKWFAPTELPTGLHLPHIVSTKTAAPLSAAQVRALVGQVELSGKKLTQAQLDVLTKHFAAKHPAMFLDVTKKAVNGLTLDQVLNLRTLLSLKDITGSLTQVIQVNFLISLGITPSHFFRIIWLTKELLGGILVSPTEIVELAWYVGTGVFGSGFRELEFSKGWMTYLWNWGDSLLFAFFEDENTYGLVRLFYYLSIGQPEVALK